MLYALRPPFVDFFEFFAFHMGEVLSKLDFKFYGEFRYLRIIIGFIALSAIITVFWKGIKG